MAHRQNSILAKPRLHSSARLLLSGACIVFLLFSPACDKTVQPGQDAARIIIGESIDGVRIGDDSATVVQKLGTPSSIIAPRFQGWTLGYDNGTHAGMGLLIRDIGRSSRMGVASVTVISPYTGKTSDGIGIGVNQALVLSRLGNPIDTLPTMSGLLVRYVYGITDFQVGYTNDTVSSLGIVANSY